MNFKNSSVSKKSFSNILLRYLVYCITAITLIVSTTYYCFSVKSSIYHINKGYEAATKSIGYATEYMDSLIKMVVSQIYLDPSISQLMNSETLNYEDVSQGIQKIKMISLTIPFIQSINVYNGLTDTFYTTSNTESVIKGTDFSDQALVASFKEPKNLPILYPVLRKLPLPTTLTTINNTLNVFTFYYYELSHDKKSIQTAIVINLSAEWLFNLVSAINPFGQNSIIVIDSSGALLTRFNDYNFLTNMHRETYIEKILDSSSPTGSFTQTISGKKYLLNYTTPKYFNWKFIGVCPYHPILIEATSTYIVTILTTLSLLIAGLILSYRISKKVYRPIDTAFKKLNDQLINNPYDIKILKQNHLCDLLTMPIEHNPLTLAANFNRYHINLNPNDTIALILLRIDGYRLFCDTYNSEDQTLFKFSILNIATEIISRHLQCEAVDLNTDTLIIICKIPNHTDNAILSHVILKEVQDKIKEYLSFSVSIVVSEQGMLLTDISKLYTASYTLSFERFCLGSACILFSNTILPYSDSEYVYPISKSNHLHEAILLHKPEIAKNLYLEIEHSLVGHKYSVSQENLLRTYFIISNALEQLTPTPSFFSFPIYLENLRTCETFEEVNALLMNIWNDFESYTLTRENSKYNEHIQGVYQLIENNYTDFNLSSDTISDALGISTGYVNKLFKKEVGKSIADYLRDFRLSKSVYYLLQTNKSVEEIATLCGFTNTKYFYTLFKKAYCMTPNEYRKATQNTPIE